MNGLLSLVNVVFDILLDSLDGVFGFGIENGGARGVPRGSQSCKRCQRSSFLGFRLGILSRGFFRDFPITNRDGVNFTKASGFTLMG